MIKIKTIGRILKEAIRDLCAIWGDEMKMTVKDQGVLIFFIIAPIVYPLLYSWIYNNEVVREVPIAVIDHSRSTNSRQFIRMCDASPNVKVAYYCNNMDEAKELIGKQEVHGIIYFPTDFHTNLNRGEQTQVGVYCDMSLMLTYKAIYQTSQEVASQLNSEIQINKAGGFTNRDDEITASPLAIEEVEIFNTTGGYGNFLLPAVLILIIQQTLLLGIGLAAGTSREQNRYGDLVPINKHYSGVFKIVGGKASCYFMIYAVITAYLVLILPRLFSYTMIASPQALIGLLVPYLLSCIFFGMTLSCLIRYRENVMLIIVVTSVLFLFMTGISWPQSNIPGFWQGVSWIVPSTFGIRGFLKISSMGGTLADAQIEYFALWAQSLIYFFAACLVYQIQINRAKRHIDEDE